MFPAMAFFCSVCALISGRSGMYPRKSLVPYAGVVPSKLAKTLADIDIYGALTTLYQSGLRGLPGFRGNFMKCNCEDISLRYDSTYVSRTTMATNSLAPVSYT